MIDFVFQEVNEGIIFNIKADNGKILASSKVYKNKKNALNDMATIVKIAALSIVDKQNNKYPKFEIYTDEDKKYYFCLKKDKNKVLITSHAYNSTSACKKAILLIKNSLRIKKGNN